MLRVLRALRFRGLFENQTYNVFRSYLLARSSLIHEPVDPKGRAVAACA
jgi:hypothetical protein